MGAHPVGQLDRQLEDLLARLRAAGGDPVSFDELRAQGIENPALLAYELEVAGIPVGRVPLHGGAASPPVAVQLDYDDSEDTRQMAAIELPDHPLQRLRSGVERLTLLLADTREEAAELSARASAAVRGRAASREPARPPAPPPPPAATSGAGGWYRGEPKRAAAIAALGLVCLTILALVLANLAGSSNGGASALRADTSARRARVKTVHSAAPVQPAVSTPAAQATPTAPVAPPQAASATPPASTATAAGQTPPPATTPVPPPASSAGASPPQAAAAMQAQGHRLLAEGQYEQAISQLRGAVSASGQSVAQCAEPSSETCLTYAYALYDLGRALRLDGQTASALAVLGERLQIDNQRPVVEGEIALARGAGSGTASAGAPPQPAQPKPAPSLRHLARRRAHDNARRLRALRRLQRTGGVGASGD
jgi:hypothetical protein